MTHQTIKTNPAGGQTVQYDSPVKLNWFTRLFFRHVWKETGREFLREEKRRKIIDIFHDEIVYDKVFAVYEQCVRSGEKRVREKWESDLQEL